MIMVAATPKDLEYKDLWRNHDKTCGLLHGKVCWKNCPNRKPLKTRKTR